MSKESIILQVFRNKILLREILNKTRDDIEFLGIQVPNNAVRVEVKDSQMTYHCKRKRFYHLGTDLVWLIKNRYYAVIKELLLKQDERPRFKKENFFSPNSDFIQVAMTSIDDAETFSLILSNYHQDFKDYFQEYFDPEALRTRVHFKNESFPPSDFLVSLINNHGNIDIWNTFIQFIDFKCLNKNIDQPPPPSSSSTTKEKNSIFSRLFSSSSSKGKEKEKDDKEKYSMLYVLSYFHKQPINDAYKQVFFISDLIKHCLYSGRKSILHHIINHFGKSISKHLEEVCLEQKLSVPTLGVPFNYVIRRDIQKEMILGLRENLPLSVFNQIYYNTDHQFVADHMHLAYDLLEKDHSHWIHVYLANNPLNNCKDDGDIIKAHYDCLVNMFTKYKNQLLKSIDISKMNDTIPHLFQQDPSLPVPTEYYQLWIFELYKRYTLMPPPAVVFVTIQKQSHPLFEEYIIKTISKNYGNITDYSSMDLVSYLLDRCGFTMITRYGSVELVKLAYDFLREHRRNRYTHLISLQSNDIQVIEFLVGEVIYNNVNTWDKPGHFGGEIQKAVDEHVEKGNFAIAEYLIENAGKISYDYQASTISKLLQNGSYKSIEAMKLQTDISMPANFKISVQTLPALKYFHIGRVFFKPEYGTSTLKRDQELTQMLFELYDDEIESNSIITNKLVDVFKKAVDSAFLSNNLDMIEYLNYYYETNKSRFKSQKELLFRAIDLDRIISSMNFEMLALVIKLQFPLKTSYMTSWRTVGMYGSLEWVEKVLYNSSFRPVSDRDRIPLLAALKSGALLNKSLENRKAIIAHVESIPNCNNSY
ncbi:hypothetical protein DFA_01575 [Cavenderia fasciculata]|uniref:Uncharacterized protein n=1 Tax=Cavenderia fasciculata TaxID=261658 RepID=F4PTL9_CACFS|nr:uncharacterized protein DFA_01575 [Cavenderia fasciculata]EGG21689.1 hypothetical protein DFA_01575 [Cavenderia fasciculata]|eukprot:XP_004359539.1 hypothetical protein DFA_01575 [Cavenderia fasciculata]